MKEGGKVRRDDGCEGGGGEKRERESDMILRGADVSCSHAGRRMGFYSKLDSVTKNLQLMLLYPTATATITTTTTTAINTTTNSCSSSWSSVRRTQQGSTRIRFRQIPTICPP